MRLRGRAVAPDVPVDARPAVAASCLPLWRPPSCTALAPWRSSPVADDAHRASIVLWRASTRLPAPRDEPVLPISSTADKVKGLAIFLVALVGSGFLLNYAFSPNSVFLASPEPKVNEGLRKYAGVIESASR